MVLVDDVTLNGKLDLLVTTMNGNVFVFETAGAYHPLRTWTAEVMRLATATISMGLQGRGAETMVCRDGRVGIFVSKESRESRDIRGDNFIVRFTIVDQRPQASDGRYGPYNVTIVLKVARFNDNAGDGFVFVERRRGRYEHGCFTSHWSGGHVPAARDV